MLTYLMAWWRKSHFYLIIYCLLRRQSQSGKTRTVEHQTYDLEYKCDKATRVSLILSRMTHKGSLQMSRLHAPNDEPSGCIKSWRLTCTVYICFGNPTLILDNSLWITIFRNTFTDLCKLLFWQLLTCNIWGSLSPNIFFNYNFWQHDTLISTH